MNQSDFDNIGFEDIEHLEWNSEYDIYRTTKSLYFAWHIISTREQMHISYYLFQNGRLVFFGPPYKFIRHNNPIYRDAAKFAYENFEKLELKY